MDLTRRVGIKVIIPQSIYFYSKSTDFIVFIHILCIILFFDLFWGDTVLKPKVNSSPWLISYLSASLLRCWEVFLFKYNDGIQKAIKGSIQRQKRDMVCFCSIQKTRQEKQKEKWNGIFYKTRDIRLGTRVYCQKHWKSWLSAAQ